MMRFYVLSLEPTLFGEVGLVRHWGRIGTRGRQRIDLHENAVDATRALGRLAEAKRLKGYR